MTDIIKVRLNERENWKHAQETFLVPSAGPVRMKTGVGTYYLGIIMSVIWSST